jgi:NADPH2:quinone reductase
MVKAVQIQSYGGPEVMEVVDLPVAEPGPGQVLMRNTAIGFNFIDTYHRTGLYPLPLPTGLGVEATGIIEAVGDGVADLQSVTKWPPWAVARCLLRGAFVGCPHGYQAARWHW